MEILTVLMTDDGGTCFGGTDLPLEQIDFAPPSPTGYEVSLALPADGIRIMRTPADYHDEFHHCPQRMFVILLSGRLRLETSDGDHRVIETGGMFINEDIVGQGHRMMEIDGGEYELALIGLSMTPRVQNS